MSQDGARKILDSFADRALLLDLTDANSKKFDILPPPMAGFFEFSMMRMRADIDQKALGRLFYEYLNVDQDFIKALFPRVKSASGGCSCMNPL